MRKIVCLLSLILVFGISSCSKDDDFDSNLLVGQWERQYVVIKTINTKNNEVLQDTVIQSPWSFKLYENWTGADIGENRYWDYSLDGNKIKLGGYEGTLEELTSIEMRITRIKESFSYEHETYIKSIQTDVFAKVK